MEAPIQKITSIIIDTIDYLSNVCDSGQAERNVKNKICSDFRCFLNSVETWKQEIDAITTEIINKPEMKSECTSVISKSDFIAVQSLLEETKIIREKEFQTVVKGSKKKGMIIKEQLEPLNNKNKPPETLKTGIKSTKTFQSRIKPPNTYIQGIIQPQEHLKPEIKPPIKSEIKELETLLKNESESLLKKESETLLKKESKTLLKKETETVSKKETETLSKKHSEVFVVGAIPKQKTNLEQISSKTQKYQISRGIKMLLKKHETTLTQVTSRLNEENKLSARDDFLARLYVNKNCNKEMINSGLNHQDVTNVYTYTDLKDLKAYSQLMYAIWSLKLDIYIYNTLIDIVIPLLKGMKSRQSYYLHLIRCMFVLLKDEYATFPIFLKDNLKF